MKFKKLIAKAELLFKAEQQIQKKSIKKVLKKLSKKQKKLKKEKKAEAYQETRDELDKKIALTKMHRKKGISLLKQMQESSDQDQKDNCS